MASPPAFPLDDDDENDGFDWEAAVREIDNACNLASASTSSTDHHHNQGKDFATPVAGTAAATSVLCGQKGKARQSTLDRFVDSFAAKRAKRNDESTFRAGGAKVDEERIVECGEPAAVNIDFEAAKTWVYPINVPLRDYQLSITKSALFSNTLVALPTGLGKTLIAAVVMYNYFRWFPEGKIVFTAPSRPLVMQQIEACHNIVGIPQVWKSDVLKSCFPVLAFDGHSTFFQFPNEHFEEIDTNRLQDWTIDMTGQMSPPKRSTYWKSKRVFFVTPQILEKDIQSGICMVKQLVCLVIDEAHRASGNYSYCVAVRELLAVPVHLRILALTATPGSKQPAIQNVIDNLCISTLEYRNETDHDVSPYVHNRKLELIKVPLGKDASEINNLILEVIRPYVSRLCAVGVLYNKDLATLSPCELLNSRDKFRQAPPSTLPHAKYGEVEGHYGVLITLYHIRKLLSSHGIRPAYEMLEEKLKQGPFARMMSRNETIWKVKLLMQKSLSHGASNPKLVKLIEVLIDHFKTKDPKDSRVIIFSNFRGSVKDIMDSLTTISDVVKATEFIGQSSGKTLKGQTQKMQQAVLQKFRAGGYNIIVATSIGEEGLDIMEVDLVICFDANVSPLRMIQRMGRTGRKHDGRVVVLACEGTELKGYLKKEASSKVVRKHMRNGGLTSFDFHASPRMIPHVCRPEVQFVELSIEQFVPRGKKTKDDVVDESSISKKISDEEKALIFKYFSPHEEDTWMPSLIAFPSFQSFPSRVHNVRHSFKTTVMLIDAMQRLQGYSFSRVIKASSSKVETSSQSLAGAFTAKNDTAHSDILTQGDLVNDDGLHDISQKGPAAEATCVGTLPSNYECQKSLRHRFLFGGDFVAINESGSVSILSIPTSFIKGSIFCKSIFSESINESPCKRKDEVASLKASALHRDSLHLQLQNVLRLPASTESMNENHHRISPPQSPVSDAVLVGQHENLLLQTPVPKSDYVYSEDSVMETPDETKRTDCHNLVDDTREILRNMELSPRLSYFVDEGVVPESPIAGMPAGSFGVLSEKIQMNATSRSAILSNSIPKESTVPEPLCSIKPSSESPITKGGITDTRTEATPQDSPLLNTPLFKPVSNSSSGDWHMSSEGTPESVPQAPKYKRLRKYGDKHRGLAHKALSNNFNGSNTNINDPDSNFRSNKVILLQGKVENGKIYVRDFIEEEAEVSDDAEVSGDEEENGNVDKYEDSFIDDRTNPTATNTPTGDTGEDMMAFYRRSLLTQCPLEALPRCLLRSYDSVASRSGGSGSCSTGKINSSLQTPRFSSSSTNHSISKNSVTCQLDANEVNLIDHADVSKSTTRKRKLSFQLPCSTEVQNFQHKDLDQETSEKPLLNDNPGNTEVDNDLFCDDEFYQSLDLDAVEAQAAELLRYKTELPLNDIPPTLPNEIIAHKGDSLVDNFSHPSFDLGV